MDITTLSMGLAQSQLMTNVGTALLSKSLEQASQTGANLTELLDSASLEHSVNPDLGTNIDIRI